MKIFLFFLISIIITNCSIVQKTPETNTEIVSEYYYLSMDCESLAAEHNSLLRDLKKHSSNKSAGLSTAKIAVFFIEDKLRVTEAAYKINKCDS